MIYLLCGEDSFSAEKEAKALLQAEKCDEVIKNIPGLPELLTHLQTGSFFAKKRGILASRVLSGITKKEDEELAKVLELTGKSDTVVFIEERDQKSGKAAQWIQKNGKVKHFSGKRDDTANFIKDSVSSLGGTIAPLAVEKLTTAVNGDYWQLSEEIKKLVLYKTGDHGIEQIDSADVDLLVHSDLAANIFNLIDSVVGGNKKKAAEQIRSFMEAGENSIYIVTMIYKQLRNVAIAKFGKEIKESTLVKKFGIHPYVAKKTLSQARNISKDEIIYFYNRLSEADLRLKSGSNPEQVLYQIIA